MTKQPKQKESIPVKAFFARFANDEACLVHLFNVRFSPDHVCPKCDRASKWYRISATRAFSCGSCGHHIHPTVGTLFEDSRTSLQTWFYAIYLFTTSRHGVSGKELERQLGVTYKTAWRIGHQIRTHMAMVDGEELLFGEVEVDETFIGPKGPQAEKVRGKTIILGMLQRDGDLMTKIIPDNKKKSLIPAVCQNVTNGSQIHTDTWFGYKMLPKFGFAYECTDHSAKEYARPLENGGVTHVNTLEAFWKHFKASVKGTHIHVSRKHMSKYTKEFEYRFNSRKNPKQMVPELVSSFAGLKPGSQVAPSTEQPF